MNIISTLLVMLLLQSTTAEGRVMKAGTSEALERATVELKAVAGDRVLYRVIAARDGRFVFPAVTPGQYRVAVALAGYVATEYGQKKSSGRGSIIEIGSQPLTDLQVHLTPTGAISGRVIDQIGRPIVKAEVQVFRPSYPDGVRVLTPVRSAVTNDLGEYRLYWLPPGSYFLGAIGPTWQSGLSIGIITGPGAPVTALGSFGGGGGGAFNPLTSARLADDSTAPTSRYQTVYYPNTSDDQAAQPIEVGPAGEASAEIILSSSIRTRHVRVRVSDETNGPAPTQYRLQALPAVAGVVTSKPYRPSNEYETDISTAATILTINAPFGPPLPRDPPVPLRMGRIAIPAGDSDMAVEIVMKAGKPLQGRVVLDGSGSTEEPPKLSSLQVGLIVEPKGLLLPFLLARSQEGLVSDSGAFTFPNVFEGAYHVSVTIPDTLQRAYVQSIQFGETDVLNGVLRFPGQPDNALTVIIANNAGSLTGIVTNDRREPDAEATVVLVPANRGRSDLYRVAKSDASGQFRLDRIPPGDYKLFAWDEVESGAWQDPQFMKPYEDRGTPIHVDAGSSGTISLLVIKA